MLKKKSLAELTQKTRESIQSSIKQITRMETNYEDPAEKLRDRLEDEIADAMAAAEIVIRKFDLNREIITERSNVKHRLLEKWMSENETTRLHF